MSNPTTLKHKVGKHHFELLVNLDKVKLFRKGQLGFDKCLISDEIFTSISKGDRPSASVLSECFPKCSTNEKIIQYILSECELPLSKQDRKIAIETLTNKITSYFNLQYIDPTSSRPHPQARVKAALEDLKYHVDLSIPFEKHISTLEKLFPGHLPLKKMEMEGLLTISNKYLGPIFGSLKSNAKIVNTKYGPENAQIQLTCAPGQMEGLFNILGKLTQNDFDLVFAEEGATEAISTTPVQSTRSKKPKKASKNSKSSTNFSSSSTTKTSSKSPHTSHSKKKKRKS